MLFRAMKLHKLTLALMIEATSLWGLDPTTVGPRKKMASQQPEGDLQGHNHITHHTFHSLILSSRPFHPGSDQVWCDTT